MLPSRAGATDPPERGLTLVAFYGDKEAALQTFLEAVQESVIRWGGGGVVLRPLAEVHATVLGLRDVGAPGPAPSGDVDGLCRYLVARLAAETITVRFGGYHPGVAYGLTSRGEPLHRRSVVVSDRQVVVLGWPWSDGRASPFLDEVRRAGDRFGYRHKYHQAVADVDPDAYMVVADLERAPTADQRRALEQRLRRWLQSRAVEVPLDAGQLSLLEYVDNRLPRATTTRRALPT